MSLASLWFMAETSKWIDFWLERLITVKRVLLFRILSDFLLTGIKVVHIDIVVDEEGASSTSVDKGWHATITFSPQLFHLSNWLISLVIFVVVSGLCCCCCCCCRWETEGNGTGRKARQGKAAERRPFLVSIAAANSASQIPHIAAIVIRFTALFRMMTMVCTVLPFRLFFTVIGRQQRRSRQLLFWPIYLASRQYSLWAIHIYKFDYFYIHIIFVLSTYLYIYRYCI